jgi:hypothetical protein
VKSRIDIVGTGFEGSYPQPLSAEQSHQTDGNGGFTASAIGSRYDKSVVHAAKIEKLGKTVGLLSSDINHGVVAYLAPPIFNSAQRKAKRNVGLPDKADFKSCKGDLRFKPSLQDLIRLFALYPRLRHWAEINMTFSQFRT